MQLIDTEPLPQIPSITKQSQVADYVVDLVESASTCKENMKAIKAFNEGSK